MTIPALAVTAACALVIWYVLGYFDPYGRDLAFYYAVGVFKHLVFHTLIPVWILVFGMSTILSMVTGVKSLGASLGLGIVGVLLACLALFVALCVSAYAYSPAEVSTWIADEAMPVITKLLSPTIIRLCVVIIGFAILLKPIFGKIGGSGSGGHKAAH